MSWQSSAVMHVSWTQSSSGKGILYSNSAPINTYVYSFLLGVIPCLKQIYFKWHFTNHLTKDMQDPCIKLQTRLHTVLTARIQVVRWLPSTSSWWDATALEEFYYLWLQSFFTFRSVYLRYNRLITMELCQMVKAHHKQKDDETWRTQEMFKLVQNGYKFQTLPVTLLYNETLIFIPGASTDQQCHAA
jgi:hypothetical protein